MKKFLRKYDAAIVVSGCVIGFVGMLAAFAFQWEGGLILFEAGFLSMFLPMLSD